ncbi:MAG: glycoside hydrolase family 127 protein [Clostridia bacterium]|nr:glycoside hydrolase family 127 protein [Clostridia bacterium]
MNDKHAASFAPLRPFPFSAVRPEGWILRQLRIQAEGLAGNLDRMWPDVRDSAWIGGNREGWERVPYWLDGFVPLAFLLRDEEMISRAKRYLNAIMDNQKEDGWICPCAEDKRADYDVWALFLIGKVLAEYGLYAEDDRALDCVEKAMRNLLDRLNKEETRLFQWGKFRWFEALIPLKILKDRKDEPWINELAALLKEKGADYSAFTEDWKVPLFAWQIQRHIVNLGMMLKSEAAYLPFTDEPYRDVASELYRILDRYNGTAVGIVNGDECLAGVSPVAGTELCAVVEMMYSCEILFAMTGDPKWADLLERVAFNALPAATSEDMWTHQYDQQANQMACAHLPGKSPWMTNGAESNMFGLEPEYGCCTANFGQGWPKLAHRIFLQNEEEIVASVPLSWKVETVRDGAKISVEAKGDYPFSKQTAYTVVTDRPVRFRFRIRIPAGAKAQINGKPVRGPFFTADKLWTGRTELVLSLTFKAELLPRPKKMYAANYGPLVFVLPVRGKWVMHEFVRNGIERKFPYADYEVLPESDWAFGFYDKSVSVSFRPMPDIPFSESKPGMTMEAAVAPVEWHTLRGYRTVADRYPAHRKATGPAERMTFIPYGCSKLRMTELPLVLREDAEQTETKS